MRSHTIFIFYLSISILFSSCAILNEPSQKIHLASNISTDRVAVEDRTRRLVDGKLSFELERSKDCLVIGIEDGDSLYQFSFSSHNSMAYLCAAVATAGISTLFEKNIPRRFGHQKHIYLEKNDSAIRVFRFAPDHKGTINLNFSIPYANYIYLNTTKGYKHTAGFNGLAGTAEFFYSTNNYLSLQAGAATDFFAPLPAPADRSGLYDQSSVVFGSLRNNHTIRSFDIGYGVSIAQYRWHQYNTHDSLFVNQKKSSLGMGLSLSAQYRIGKHFRLGLLYQPTMLSLDSGVPNSYQHLLSLELIFKFKVKQGR